jgi:hypothetical protein
VDVEKKKHRFNQTVFPLRVFARGKAAFPMKGEWPLPESFENLVQARKRAS